MDAGDIKLSTRNLESNDIDYEIVDLGISNLNNNTVDLESVNLDPQGLNTLRLKEIEKTVRQLQSEENVRYDINQQLTELEKQRVRNNIGIIDVNKILIDTSERWNNMIGYIPPEGTIIIYKNKTSIDGVDVPGIKIGSGNAYVQDLAFVNEDLESILLEHINNMIIHITSEERARWNNKVNIDDRTEDVSGETLVFTRNF